MVYAIPAYIYVEASSPQEAAAMKAKVEKLLENPLLKTVMGQSQIPYKGAHVMDPILSR